MNSIFHQTWQTLVAHRTKNMLATITIAWGIVSVLVLSALGEGFYMRQTLEMSFMNNNVQIAYPSSTSKAWHGLPSRRKIHVEQDHVEMIKQADFIEDASSVYIKRKADVTIKGLHLTDTVFGTDSSYFSLAQHKLELGSRNFSPSDIANRARVVVLGNKIAKSRKINIGQTIRIQGIPFVVIGIIRAKFNSFEFGDERNAIIPLTTYLDLWQGKPDKLLFKPIQGMNKTSLRRTLVHFYAKQFKFDPTDHVAIYFPDHSSFAQRYTQIFRVIHIFLFASGAMTLAIGVLGVANIMFLSVSERTREIGVRLAIGATPKSILNLFILEGLCLVTFGTVLGLMVTLMVVESLGSITLPSWLGYPVITPGSIFWSLILTLILALLASYFPAKRASRLTPVIALSSRT
ncbi:ABC transporter permease [Vibrio ouci]|uniref:FtsX-like permease family protein n=1 Tax=Vibrio ouci TaxID=2499078 RepID=A0A4Y8WHZ2_9VIBR|nr:ABC transporter permease [Vibrio ouci]TFH92550.1 FtsX-like permease family protein [Vibrio ouci]